MAFISIGIPKGFDAKRSFIKWQGQVEVDNGQGSAGGSFHRQALSSAGKLREVVQPHSKGGTVRIIVNLSYQLGILEDAPSGPQKIPKEVEDDSFSFGCEWPYTFSQGELAFGPAQKFTSPSSRGFKILQASCEDIQSKDQVGSKVRPYVYTSPVLSLKSVPGESNGWSYQLPVVGGPSYTPPGGEPTPDNGFRLGSFWIEFDVRTPEIKVEIDRNLLQLTLVFENERQSDLSGARFGELTKWIDAIQKSNLFPVIQNKYLQIHMRGHASKPGSALDNQDLSTTRRKNVQKRLEAMINAPVEIVPWDRGSQDASPVKADPKDRNKALLLDRNVTIYIEENEAKDALVRYTKEVGKQ